MEVERLDWKNIKFLIHITILRPPTQDKHLQSDVMNIPLWLLCQWRPTEVSKSCSLHLDPLQNWKNILSELALVCSVQCYASS